MGLPRVTYGAESDAMGPPHSTALSCWASGSGAAGLGGALLYVGLTQGGLLRPTRALLPLLLLPPTMLAR